MESVPIEERHPAWHDLAARVLRRTFDRRSFLRVAGAAAAGIAASPLLKFGRSAADPIGPATPGLSLPDMAAWPTTNPIKHVVILCQENRSFDHYFGKFGAAEFGTTGNRPEVFDPESTYANTAGKEFSPFHLEYFCDFDPDHSWAGSHAKWNNSAMDGWVKGEVDESPLVLGYYDAADHIYHVQLAQSFALADHYFCSQISQTLPNRLYLWTGTSGWDSLDLSQTGGLPYDNPSITQVPPTLSWATLPDVLDDAKLPWRSYSVADGSVPSPIGSFNPLIYFSQFQSNPVRLANALAPIDRFFVDLATGQLPAVSFIVTQAAVSEHPPAPPDMGQLLAARVVRALMESSAWESSALILTYDEGGGYFEHVPTDILEEVPSGPRKGEAIGPAFRVPTVLVSPYAKRNYVYKDPVDHTSTLQFIERTFNLPPTLPISPQRRTDLGDLREAFDFGELRPPPALPALEDLFKLANETVLTTDVHRGVVECGTTVPRWLPPLLGQPSILPYPQPSPK